VTSGCFKAGYCFIVADIVGKLAHDWTYSWRRTADGCGRFYQPQSYFKGHIEIIPWNNLVQDARERNKAFFDPMGIDNTNLFNGVG